MMTTHEPDPLSPVGNFSGASRASVLEAISGCFARRDAAIGSAAAMVDPLKLCDLFRIACARLSR